MTILIFKVQEPSLVEWPKEVIVAQNVFSIALIQVNPPNRITNVTENITQVSISSKKSEEITIC